MNDTTRTGMYLGGALAALLLAYGSAPGEANPDVFSDEGEILFPDFTEPARAASLEVWSYDEELGEGVAFKVEQQSTGKWTIPSHHGYPADAKDRMAKAASMLIGIAKDRVISDNRDDHPDLGVVDPLDENLDLAGRGARITLRNRAGTALADLIVGDTTGEGPNALRYVRLPGKKRTYACKMEYDLSTDFADWIEQDLLEVGTWDLSEIVFDNYSIDERQGTVVPGETLTLGKEDGKWALAGLAEGESTNDTASSEVATTLADLAIVGVRPKPEGLTERLEASRGINRQILLGALQSKGYFLGPQGKLYSNEGDLIAKSNKGVVYTLRFGEIVYGTGDAITSGAADPAAAQPAPDGTGPAAPGEGSHRYLMVTTEFDESLLEKPEGTPLPEGEWEKREQTRPIVEGLMAAVTAYQQANDNKLPDTLEALTAGDAPQIQSIEKDAWGNDLDYTVTEDGFVIRSFGTDGIPGGEGVNQDLVSDNLGAEDDLRQQKEDFERFETKVQEGKDLVDALNRRFGAWYYVIDAESFGKLRKGRSDLVVTAAAETETGEGK